MIRTGASVVEMKAPAVEQEPFNHILATGPVRVNTRNLGDLGDQ